MVVEEKNLGGGGGGGGGGDAGDALDDHIEKGDIAKEPEEEEDNHAIFSIAPFNISSIWFWGVHPSHLV